mmetsp:Transcript_102186/g.125004  ORF Transcript_102186/g.125004 Transcript_102186/m.125004 type:complete len:548 (-) Transcript_102186:20-1663(-)
MSFKLNVMTTIDETNDDELFREINNDNTSMDNITEEQEIAWEKRMKQMETASKIMGKLLLSGWTMEKDICSTCNSPLFSKNGGHKLCPLCDMNDDGGEIKRDNNDDNKDDDDVGFTFNQISKHTRTGSLLMRRHSIVDLNDEKDELIFKQANDKERLQMLKSQNDQLKNLLILAENQQYGVNENPNVLSPSDIETIRAIFDNTVGDLSGTIDSTQKAIKLLYKKMGDIITDKEASKILKKLDPNNEGEIAFNSFLMYWHNSHKYGKKGKEYGKKFKFLSNKLKGKFDANKLTIKKVGKQFTTDFRFYFEYEQIDGQLKRISPWHDIPLWYTNDKTGIYNFVCEIPKWTRAKWEIATGEEYNPIKQDIKNGKLRFYKHGDMMFNYGAFPQTWEDPEHIPKDTGCVGDNDPLDVIELGTKQLQTGSVTPVKVLGVLALLDSNETDWKILAINISDPLANLMNDVHDCEKQMPGAVHAIREYLRIYKVVTGKAENRYALRGEAMNAKYAKTVITETHQQWQLLNEQRNRPDFNASLSNINRDSVNNISIH